MGNYITLADLTLEGIPSSISPTLLERRIAKWEELVEKLTGQVFRTLTPGELIFDGNNSHLLHFNLPMIAVTSVKVNGSTTALDASEYRAHVGRQVPKDDRQNPKLELLGNRTQTIYSSSGSSWFGKGADQAITATWGYLDADGNTPAPVKQAIIELVTLDAKGYWDKLQDNEDVAITPMQRERTDGHEIEYQQMEDIRLSWSHLPGYIQSILAAYRKPWVMAVPDARFLVSASDAIVYGW